MDEYISRQAFKEKYLCCGYLPEMAEDEFDKFPATNVAEVIRCKQCEYWMGIDEFGDGYCDNPDGIDNIAKSNDFCSRGKLRENKDG